MNKDQQKRVPYFLRRPFEYVAFWQFLCFILLICVIWVNTVFDIASVIYQRPSLALEDWLGASILTALAILIGFITIAHTYTQQRRIIKGLIKICSYCHKVQIDKDMWERMEEFVADRTLAEFSHGICPTCYARVVEENGLKDTTVRPIEEASASGKPRE